MTRFDALPEVGKPVDEDLQVAGGDEPAIDFTFDRPLLVDDVGERYPVS